MRRGTRTATLCGATLLVAALTACGDAEVEVKPAGPDTGRQESGAQDDAATTARAERQQLIASCPAEAPPWTETDPEAPDAGSTDDPAALKVQADVSEAAAVADAYLATLPAAQRGGDVRVNQAGDGAVVVQVTRDPEPVQRELQRRIGGDVRAVVEVVRYPGAELRRVAGEIVEDKPVAWVSVGASADNSVHVGIADGKAVAAAKAKLAELYDPCMVKVFQEDQASTLPGG